MSESIIDKRGGHNRNEINHDFFKSWSSQMAYVLGYAFADGSLIDSEPSRTCYLRFHSVDHDILKEIAKTLCYKGKILYRKPRTIKKGPKFYKAKICHYISIGSRIIYHDLIKLGLTCKKSLNAIFPSVPQNFLPHFVRGYFDGDGCVNVSREGKRLQVVFTSGSKDFLFTLSERLASSPLSIEEKNVVMSTQSFQLRYSTQEAVRVLEFMYKDLLSCPYLKRKYVIFDKWRRTQMA